LFDLLLSSLGIYHQGVVKWDGLNASGGPTGGAISLLLGYQVPFGVDIAIMLFLMTVSSGVWLITTRKLFK
jgi:hypothetical protein